MDRQNVLLVDLPLHSPHAVQSLGNAALTSVPESQSFSIPPHMVSAWNSLHSSHQGSCKKQTKLFWSLLAYPNSDSPSQRPYFMPWNESPSLEPNIEDNSELLSKDVCANLLQLFDEIGASDLVWVIPSRRLLPTSSLPYRISRTLSYLIDVKGVRCQILMDDGALLPPNFVPVISSLDIAVRARATDVVLQDSPSYPIYPQLAPFMAISARIPQRKSNAFLHRSQTPFPTTLAFQTVSHVGADRVPISMFEGEAIVVHLGCVEEDKPGLSVEHGLVVTALLKPAIASIEHLPIWNALSYCWEYPESANLMLGPSYLLFIKNQTIYMRQLNLGSAMAPMPFLEPLRNVRPLGAEESSMNLDTVPQRDGLSEILLRLCSHPSALQRHSEPPQETKPCEEFEEESRRWYRSASAEEIDSFLDVIPSLIQEAYDRSLPSRMDVITSAEHGDDLKSASMATDDTFDTLELNFGSQVSDKPQRSQRRSKTRDSVVQALEYLWERETSAFSRLEAQSHGMKQSRRRSLISSPNGGLRDDVSTVGSESTASEPGQTLMDAIRPSPRNASTSLESPSLRKVQTSSQFRNMINRSRGVGVNTPPPRSLSSSIESNRSASPSLGMHAPLNPSLPAESPYDSPRTLPVASASSTSLAHRLSSIAPSGAAQLVQRPSESAIGRPSPSKSLNTLTRGTAKVPIVPSPFTSRTSSATSSRSTLPKLEPTRSSLRQSSPTVASNASSLPSPSIASPSAPSSGLQPSDTSNEEDNRSRLLACCRSEMGRVMAPTDRKFQDLVERLASICQIMVATRYQWDSVIPNSEFMKHASSQAKLLAQASQSK